MNNGMMGFPRAGQGERPEDPLSLRQFREESPRFTTATGSANALILKYNPPVDRLTQGLRLHFLSSAANTGAVTVTGDWSGSVNLYGPSAAGPAALVGGEIQNSQLVTAQYDGTQFVVMSAFATPTTTWTPSDQSGATLAFTSVSAAYTRIGNMVFVYGRLTFPVTASGAQISIGGLPFTIANVNYAAGTGSAAGIGGTLPLSISKTKNTTTFTFIRSDTGANLTNANLSTVPVLFDFAYAIQ